MRLLKLLGNRVQQSRISALIVIMIAVFLFFALTQPRFATVANLRGILSGIAVLWIATVGVAFVMIGGGFDLSIGSILTLSGFVMAEAFTNWGWPIWAAMILCVLSGVGMGAGVNGMLIGKFKLSFLVVTLGTFSLFGGITAIWAGLNDSEAATDRVLSDIGFGSTIGIPNTVLIALVCTIVGWYVLRWTYFGRDVYALGGNPEAARLSGINVTRTTIAIYGIAGLTAAIATIAQVGLLEAASALVSQNLMLEAATAALLGGISLGGGSGTVVGACVGVVFVGILNNGLSVMGVSGGWQSAVLGATLIVAITLDLLRKRKLDRSKASADSLDAGAQGLPLLLERESLELGASGDGAEGGVRVPAEGG